MSEFINAITLSSGFYLTFILMATELQVQDTPFSALNILFHYFGFRCSYYSEVYFQSNSLLNLSCLLFWLLKTVFTVCECVLCVHTLQCEVLLFFIIRIPCASEFSTLMSFIRSQKLYQYFKYFLFSII